MAIQDHIHLDTVIGGAPENAPTMTWKAYKRERKPMVHASVKRSVTGKLRFSAFKQADVVAVFNDYGYILKVETESDYDNLLAMLGQSVYFVDHFHAADGADHTSDIKTMILSETSKFDPFNPTQFPAQVSITLLDDDTVT